MRGSLWCNAPLSFQKPNRRHRRRQEFRAFKKIFSPYDLVLCGAGIVFVCLFAVNVFQAARQLRREDASPSRPAGIGKRPLL